MGRLGSKCIVFLKTGPVVPDFFRTTPTLIREMNNITILSVGEVEYLDVAFFGEMAFDSVHAGLEGFLTVHETRIDGELAALEPFVEKKVPEISRCFALGLRVRR